jgi:hypothetical protein
MNYPLAGFDTQAPLIIQGISTKAFRFLLLFLASLAAAQAETNPPAADKGDYHFFNPTPLEYLREMTTDGAQATDSPFTVDAGHFQIEMTLFGYSAYKESFQGVMYRLDWWNIGPINLKVGLFNNLDLQVILEPYNHSYEREEGLAPVSRTGIGDTTVRLKFNCWGNDSGMTAFALMPYLRIPTGAEGLGNDELEGGVIFPFSAALPWEFHLGLSGSIAKARKTNGHEYHTEYTASAALFRKLFGDLDGYVECFNAVSDEKGIGRATTFNTGLLYWLRDDLQLNAGVDIGLTTWADDWYAFIGASWRY